MLNLQCKLHINSYCYKRSSFISLVIDYMINNKQTISCQHRRTSQYKLYI